MKILLLGEYSGVHTNLSKALRKKGYEVTLIHNGDGYKSFEADIFIKYSYFSSKNIFFNYLLKLYYVFLMYIGVKGIFQIFKYIKVIKEMKSYNVVHLINPIFINDYGVLVNFIVFLYLKKNNNKIFLKALGDDYYWVRYCLDGNFKYSMFDRLNFKTINRFIYPLQYIYGFLIPTLNKYIAKNVNGIIPGLYDYYMPYQNFSNCTEIVPIIMPLKNKTLKKTIKFPIKIFHGWQPGKELRKGNDIFDEALKKIKLKYPKQISYEIVGGMTYQDYILTFQNADIFIDQCYSQDCGVNALLGLSEGKVVCSGFDEDVRKIYNINYSPLINCEPDVEKIYLAIESLILNPNLIIQYSENAIKFMENFHSEDYVICKYEKIWEIY